MKGHSRKRWPQPYSLSQALGLAGALPALLGMLASSCHAATRAREEEGSVRVEVRHVGFDHLSNSPVVILQDTDKKKAIPIWVGSSKRRRLPWNCKACRRPARSPMT